MIYLFFLLHFLLIGCVINFFNKFFSLFFFLPNSAQRAELVKVSMKLNKLRKLNEKDYDKMQTFKINYSLA